MHLKRLVQSSRCAAVVTVPAGGAPPHSLMPFQARLGTACASLVLSGLCSPKSMHLSQMLHLDKHHCGRQQCVLGR